MVFGRTYVPPTRTGIPFNLSQGSILGMRTLAAVHGMGLSEVLNQLVRLAIEELEFPVVPYDGVLVRKKGKDYEARRYFVDFDLADKMTEISERGYSISYLGEILVKEGLKIAQRHGQNTQDGAVLLGRALATVGGREGDQPDGEAPETGYPPLPGREDGGPETV
jgi:hypothetical protein